MKYDKMSYNDMLFYIKQMDKNEEKLKTARDRILQEIKDLQDRNEILSWDEIASAVAYPKAMSDKERVGGGNPDEFKLLHQAERINQIYRSQMEELLEELENVELQITKYKYVNRCINRLDAEDKEVIDRFTRTSLSYDEGMRLFHYSRTYLYKIQKRAIDNLMIIYNCCSER